MFNFISLDISARRKLASILYINICYYQIMQHTSIVIVGVFCLKHFLNTIMVNIIWVGMEHSLISNPIPFFVVMSQGSDHI